MILYLDKMSDITKNINNVFKKYNLTFSNEYTFIGPVKKYMLQRKYSPSYISGIDKRFKGYKDIQIMRSFHA